MHDGKPCGRELYDEERCIFHSKKKNKDLDSFQKGLNRVLSMSSETHDLTRFILPEGVVFPKILSKSITFRDAVFKGDVDLSNVVFEGHANFRGVRFHRAANFSHTFFERRASLRNAVFQDVANFGCVRFNAEADLRAPIFEKRADFAGAVFKDKALFAGVIFKNSADLGSTTFETETRFAGPRFEGTVNLSHSRFGDLLWINAEIHNKEAFHRPVSFRHGKFSKPEKVEFHKVDLSKVSFLETDVRKVHFTDVDWNKEKGKGRNRVFDEVSPDPGIKEFDYALIAQLYRRLRANYEENLRYSEAGDFYIGEMEMTRKAQTSIFKKLPLLFYKAISNYGESYYRPLGWIAVILLIFPLLFMFAGLQPVSYDQNDPMEDVIQYTLDFSSSASFLPTTEKRGDYYTSFLYSMSVFSFIRDKKYTTMNNWGQTLFVLESILSPVTLAFFLLALRRRFKR